MAGKKGNRANVTDRWYGVNKSSSWRSQTPRPAFKGEAQYTLDDLFITPFTHELTSDELGRTGYTPIVGQTTDGTMRQRNLCPTGIHVLDAYLQALSRGQSDVAEFCDRYNAKTADLDGLIFLLTGMPNQDFRNRWIVRMADLLLRYTDMTVDEIARRSGAGTRTNLYFIYERDLNTSPTDRRNALRKPGDLGKYKITEKTKE